MITLLLPLAIVGHLLVLLWSLRWVIVALRSPNSPGGGIRLESVQEPSEVRLKVVDYLFISLNCTGPLGCTAIKVSEEGFLVLAILEGEELTLIEGVVGLLIDGCPNYLIAAYGSRHPVWWRVGSWPLGIV